MQFMLQEEVEDLSITYNDFIIRKTIQNVHHRGSGSTSRCTSLLFGLFNCFLSYLIAFVLLESEHFVKYKSQICS